MNNPGIFDCIGPIMVGPSSSHTAGAARLGKIARKIAGGEIKKVKFLLHGSFAKTYKGHGTDRALIAGILGMEPSDKDLRNSLEIASSRGLEYEFIEEDLGDVHPNTVKFLLVTEEGNCSEVIGSSIGGGSIEIINVNGTEVNFTGEYETLIVTLIDIAGAVSKVSSILYENNINIAFMKVFRKQKGKEATMIFELDNSILDEIVEKIKRIDHVNKVIKIQPISEAE